jgi:Lipocalin-like domain
MGRAEGPVSSSARAVGGHQTFSEQAFIAVVCARAFSIREEIMNRRSVLSISVMTMLGLAVLPSGAISQQKSLKDQLVGTWTFVSSTTKLPDGSPVWGSNPKGLVIFTENGRYSSHVMRTDRPKFAANSRAKGTPEENKAAVLVARFNQFERI